MSKFYQEGYDDGMEYQAQYPGYIAQGDYGTWKCVQDSLSTVNQEMLGYSEAEDGQHQAGFLDGYRGYPYGDGLYASLDQFEE